MIDEKGKGVAPVAGALGEGLLAGISFADRVDVIGC